MILAELLDNNNQIVRTSLDLIEESTRERDVEAMVKDVATTQEPHELAKGMFIAVKTLMYAMRETYDFSALREFLNADIKGKALAGKNVSIDYKIISILELMEEGGGSFYLQIHSLPDPVETVVSLINMFKRLTFLYFQEDPQRDALKAIPDLTEELKKYSRAKAQRQQEQKQLIAVMRAEKSATEDALHLMEVLAPHWLIDVTEDGEKIPHLNEKAFQIEEVRKAINVPHQVDLLKGLCLVTCVFLSQNLLAAGNSISFILEHRRKEIEAESLDPISDDDAIKIQYNAIDLLECAAMIDEEGFYQKAYAIDDVEDVILSLSTSLHRTSRYVADQDTKTFISDFRDLLK